MINISSLSNEQLLTAVTKEAASERRSTADVVRYLAEIESRRLHLELGFSSLFDFTTKKLGYSSSSALRRIKAARLTLADPSIASKLETGELNFATIDILANFVKQPELKTITQELCGRSREDAEKIVAHLRPVAKSAVRDRVKPIVVAKPTADRNLPSLPFEPEQNSNNLRPNAQSDAHKCIAFGAQPEELFHISFAMTRDERALLERTRQLMFAGDVDTISFGKVIAKLAKFYLAYHCPRERQKRREAREKGRVESTRKERQSSAELAAHAQPIPDREPRRASPRAISRVLRDRVLARDGYRCVFTAQDGTRCSCASDLEIDHITPVARGGGAEEANLRVLCRAHNLERAYQVFGEGYVRQRITAQEVRGTI